MNPKSILMFIMLFPFIGSFIGFIIGRKNEKYRDVFNIFMTVMVLIAVIALFPHIKQGSVDVSIPYIMGMGMHLTINAFRYVFVLIATFAWTVITIYSNEYLKKYKYRNRYYLFFMLTLWSTIGIFISENFINLFTFFEIMSLTSYTLVIHDENDHCHHAGHTYKVMAFTGALILLMGLFLLYYYTNTLSIMELPMAVKDMGSIKYLIVLLITIGFGIKAGIVPLHIWLPQAHPAAPAPASAILSGILLKTGIFGILITVQTIVKDDLIVATIILVLGFVNMFLGGFLAMFQKNIKAILAYSSMSQIGYILVGIGLIGLLKDHGALAAYGTLYHVINHAIFKILLFLIAGIIYIKLHELDIDKIKGFGRKNTPLKILFLIGMFGIIAMPGFNGFVSKNLIHHALAEAHHMYHGSIFIVAEIVFKLSSSFTVAYLLKIFIAVFVEKGEESVEAKRSISLKAIVPMGVLAAAIIYIGVRPGSIIAILKPALAYFAIKPAELHFYTFGDIKGSVTTIALGVMIYVFFIRKYLRIRVGETWTYQNVTTNWFSIEKHVYKPIGKVLFDVSHGLSKVADQCLVVVVRVLGNGLRFVGSIEVKTGRVMSDTKDNSESFLSLNERMLELSRKFNSVTYSVALFGVVLVACLIVMMN